MAANNNETGNVSNVENNNTQKVVKMKAPKNATEFITGFVDGTINEDRKHDRWSTYWWGGLIVLEYTVPEKTTRGWNGISNTEPAKHEIVAYRLQDGSVIYNANVLEYAGRKIAWGHKMSQWGQNDIQILIEKLGGAPLPFSLFTETGTDARDFAWVVKPVAEKVTIKYEDSVWERDALGNHTERIITKTRTQHFVGACVFSIGEDHYLFDVDRQELDHNIFNPFVTKLPKHVATVAEAYDVLVPDEVRVALAQGTEVKRQGEFFFLKWSDECPVKPMLTEEEKRIVRFKPSRFGFGIDSTLSTFGDGAKYHESEADNLTPLQQEFQAAAIAYEAVMEKYRSSIATRGVLGKSASGSHSVEKFVKVEDGTTFVSGKISQARRQHADLVLEGWWAVVANTGTFSWTITGDID